MVERGAGWLRAYAGRFVVFEGPDGSGKSTQFRRLSALCKSSGVRVCEVREPGGTPVGERVREVLLDARSASAAMSARCETLLFMASRAELVDKRIIPALRAGELVLADRFVASTLAYQGAAGKVPVSDIAAVARMATRGLRPDLVLVFDVDEVTAGRRLSPLLDRMEQKGRAFHRAVREGYLRQAHEDPSRFEVIDARGDEEGVWSLLLGSLERRAGSLPEKPGLHAS